MIIEMNKIKEWLLQRIMLAAASRLFDVVLLHAPEDELTAIHFAKNTRELNISIRTYIEYLDQPGGAAR
jgi:type II secretory pathway component PulL